MFNVVIKTTLSDNQNNVNTETIKKEKQIGAFPKYRNLDNQDYGLSELTE